MIKWPNCCDSEGGVEGEAASGAGWSSTGAVTWSAASLGSRAMAPSSCVKMSLMPAVLPPLGRPPAPNRLAPSSGLPPAPGGGGVAVAAADVAVEAGGVR